MYLMYKKIRKRREIIKAATKIARWYRKLKWKRKLRKSKEWLRAGLQGWRVRRCIGFLRPYVLAYLNAESSEKTTVRRDFLRAYGFVFQRHLYIKACFVSYALQRKRS